MNTHSRHSADYLLLASLLISSFTGVSFAQSTAPHSPPNAAVVHFFDRLCDGKWYGGYSGAPFPEWPKQLPCPGKPGDDRGYVRKLSKDDVLENGRNGSGTFETFPTNQHGGFIRGIFSLQQMGTTLQSGDRFVTHVGFVKGANDGRVRFSVIYDPDPIESGDEKQLADIPKSYNGKLHSIDLDLSKYAGQQGTFILMVDASGSPTADRAVWVDTHIERKQPPTSPVPPTKTPTKTRTPTPYTPVPSSATPPPTFTPTATKTPKSQTLDGCAGTFSLSQDPMEPEADQQVTFTAALDQDCEIAYVDFWVNNAKVHTCSQPPCKFVGGPYPDGLHIFDIVAEDLLGDSIPSQNVIVEGISIDKITDVSQLEINPCPHCPEISELGPCIQQVCYGPSQPDYDVQEQNYIGCLYQNQGVSEPWMFISEGGTDGWFTDTCISSNVLAEYYCQGTGYLRELHYSCPYGCSDGACVPCNDSDGGVEPFIYGMTSLGVEDFCISDDLLREFFVQPENNTCALYHVDIECPDGCNPSIRACNETCSDGIQNQNETGVDCGGICPASCMQCYSNTLYQHNLFSYGDVIVNDTALDALYEYANCLRSEALIPDDVNNDGFFETWEVRGPCSEELDVKIYAEDYSTITASNLFGNTDAVMEAISWFVDEHMGYLSDDGRGSGVPKHQDASYTLNHSGDRGCVAGGSFWAPNGSADYCGDCEDYAILRETLMRYLGVSRDCAFCGDKINKADGTGGGHTFNVVRYRNKWRIMDYGPISAWLLDPGPDRVPFSLWNDYYGDYWCYKDKDKLGDGYLDAGCWRVKPSDKTWNYTSVNRCPSSWSGNETYQTDICP
jgi:hypothetical protein